MSVEQDLLKKFQEKNWTLAFAESCTGGDLAARLTKVPDASKVFLGSIVAYSELVKKELLGIPEELFPDQVVSEAMTKEMIRGLMDLLDVTVAVSVTGYAGPSGAEVGKIWVAYQKKGEEPKAEQLNLKGNREEIIRQAGDIIFGYLKDKLV